MPDLFLPDSEPSVLVMVGGGEGGTRGGDDAKLLSQPPTTIEPLLPPFYVHTESRRKK